MLCPEIQPLSSVTLGVAGDCLELGIGTGAGASGVLLHAEPPRMAVT